MKVETVPENIRANIMKASDIATYSIKPAITANSITKRPADTLRKIYARAMYFLKIIFDNRCIAVMSIQGQSTVKCMV